MLAASIPAVFNIPFANNAGGAYIHPIPQASQITITPGAASLYDGFPPLTDQPIPAGGIPPSIQDFNGLLYQITANQQWLQAGGLATFNSGFNTAISGYPLGAVLVMANGLGLWTSTVDGNTSNPDASGAGWMPIATATGSYLDLSVAGSSNVTLTGLQASYGIIDCGGVLTGNIVVLTPTRAGKWTINNSTTGAYTLSVQTTGGSIILPIQQGASLDIWSDGANVYSAETSTLYNATPAGTIISFAGTTAPYGFLQLPVAATTISRVAYARLFAAIGTTWGAGDGSTTFGIPYCPAGYALLNNTSGIGTATVGSVISHGHTTVASATGGGTSGGMSANDPHAHTIPMQPSSTGSTSAVGNGSGGATGPGTTNSTSIAHTHTIPALSIPSLTVNNTGGSVNAAAGMYVMLCIKY